MQPKDWGAQSPQKGILSNMAGDHVLSMHSSFLSLSLSHISLKPPCREYSFWINMNMRLSFLKQLCTFVRKVPKALITQRRQGKNQSREFTLDFFSLQAFQLRFIKIHNCFQSFCSSKDIFYSHAKHDRYVTFLHKTRENPILKSRK